MRDTSQHKAETRQRIVDAANLLFRQHGIDGVGVDAIMREAGMTHGGFYLYFPSKEALVATVSAEQLAAAAARWDSTAEQHPAPEALARIITNYLDSRYAVPTEFGCVLPALGPELARRPDSRVAIALSVRRMISVLARLVPRRGRARAEAAAMATLSTLVGAVVLARVLSDDPKLAASILAAAREHTLKPGPAKLPAVGAAAAPADMHL
jgi:TetR/AcrR family transcriptional regulator, transcriptional repressor for nem operon